MKISTKQRGFALSLLALVLLWAGGMRYVTRSLERDTERRHQEAYDEVSTSIDRLFEQLDSAGARCFEFLGYSGHEAEWTPMAIPAEPMLGSEPWASWARRFGGVATLYRLDVEGESNGWCFYLAERTDEGLLSVSRVFPYAVGRGRPDAYAEPGREGSHPPSVGQLLTASYRHYLSHPLYADSVGQRAIRLRVSLNEWLSQLSSNACYFVSRDDAPLESFEGSRIDSMDAVDFDVWMAPRGKVLLARSVPVTYSIKLRANPAANIKLERDIWFTSIGFTVVMWLLILWVAVAWAMYWLRVSRGRVSRMKREQMRLWLAQGAESDSAHTRQMARQLQLAAEREGISDTEFLDLYELARQL